MIERSKFGPLLVLCTADLTLNWFDGLLDACIGAMIAESNPSRSSFFPTLVCRLRLVPFLVESGFPDMPPILPICVVGACPLPLLVLEFGRDNSSQNAPLITGRSFVLLFVVQ